VLWSLAVLKACNPDAWCARLGRQASVGSGGGFWFRVLVFFLEVFPPFFECLHLSLKERGYLHSEWGVFHIGVASVDGMLKTRPALTPAPVRPRQARDPGQAGVRAGDVLRRGGPRAALPGAHPAGPPQCAAPPVVPGQGLQSSPRS